jgi:hypothetical protein
MKVGDMVWIKCKVVEPHESLIKVTPSGRDNWFWAGKDQCLPAEPPPDLSKMGVEIVSESGFRFVKKTVAAETGPDLNFYRTLSYDDTLQKGDIIFNSGTLNFNKVKHTTGMRVENVFTVLRDFGSTLTFYRPDKNYIFFNQG